ncbi:MAG: hypothetical protein ABJN84_04285 [Flavobacteriaceae bacterium]
MGYGHISTFSDGVFVLYAEDNQAIWRNRAGIDGCRLWTNVASFLTKNGFMQFVWGAIYWKLVATGFWDFSINTLHPIFK